MFDLNRFSYTLNLTDLSKLPLEEQIEKLKNELEACYYEREELLNHIMFLNSQILKYTDYQ